MPAAKLMSEVFERLIPNEWTANAVASGVKNITMERPLKCAFEFQ